MFNEKEFVDDEYIYDENDPQKVLIVPEDDYVTTDNEEIIKHEEILASPLIRPQTIIDKAEYTKFLLLLKSLQNGDFSK